MKTEKEVFETFPNTLGIKIGSTWTVGYGQQFGEEPVIELTCIRKQKTDYVMDESKYQFSKKAQVFDNVIYPLLHGAPRDDKEVPLARSCHLLQEYGNWLVSGIPVDENNPTPISPDTVAMFCLPMIRNSEGLEALKRTLRTLPIGKTGMEFMGEAYAAAVGTLPIDKILESQFIVLNMGSSTLEAAMAVGTREIASGVWVDEYGASCIEHSLVNVIENRYRGLTSTLDQAREIKERYSLITNNDVDAKLTRRGALSEQDIEGDLIKDEVEKFIDRVALKIADHFLPAAKSSSPVTVNALQTKGRGFLAIVGGMANMPGFKEAMHKALVEHGGISPKIAVVSPTNGVTAPAIGAWKIANLLERYRREQGVSTISEIKRKR